MKRLCLVGALLGLLDVAAATGPSDKWWPDFGANAANSHFVESEQITKRNVTQLEVAWFYPYGQTGFNPIVVDGVMYVLGRNNSLIALDAASGKERWTRKLTGDDVSNWSTSAPIIVKDQVIVGIGGDTRRRRVRQHSLDEISRR